MRQKFKAFLSISMCLSILFTLLATNVQAATAGTTITSNEIGTIDGYNYELWKDNGNTSMTLNGGGKYSCSWSNINNALFRTGKKFDKTKTHKELGNIVLDYACNYQPNGNSYLAVYGWTTDPLVEYYIIDSWGTWKPPGNVASKGKITIDGGTYDVFVTDRINQPSIIGNSSTFKQYWSVRTSKRTSGTISVSEHFKAWEKMGLNMNGKFYEASLVVEGYQSSGKANVTKMNLRIGDNPTTKKVQLGDIDMSGEVNALDLALAKQYLLGIKTSVPCPKEVLDTNKDGSFDAIDFARIKQHILGTTTLEYITITVSGN